MQNRRRFLSHLAAVTAVSATTTAAAATTNTLSTLTGSAADPIFAAIAAHQEAAATFQIEHEKLNAVDLDDTNWMPATAALSAWNAAARAVIETAPTTQAGLRALADFLRDEDRSRFARHFIERTVTTDDGYTYTMIGPALRFYDAGEVPPPVVGPSIQQVPDTIDWFIAKRSAEIAAEGR